jgi:hypothetical protein
MITARVTFPDSDPNPAGNIRTLLPWHLLTDPRDVQRYNANGLDQFGYYSPYILNAAGVWVNDWAVNNLYSWLTHDDMLKIAAMQIEDEYTVDAKMSYLCAWGDAWGNPMRVPGGLAWDVAPAVKLIGAFYAGQQVEVLETKDMLIDYMGSKTITPMVRVRTFTPADWGKTHATHPQLVHKMTGVSRDNTYREKVKGTVYLPVALSGFDFAGTFVPASHWLMARWLV